MPVTRSELLQFLRSHSLAVQSSVTTASASQSALVGIVVSDELEIFFDTLGTTRKAQNLRRNPKIAFVVGGQSRSDERTVQYEGIADEPSGGELDALKRLYFAHFPDGRERQTWPSITYFRTRPTWVRFSDYNRTPPLIVEFGAAELRGAKSTH